MSDGTSLTRGHSRRVSSVPLQCLSDGQGDVGGTNCAGGGGQLGWFISILDTASRKHICAVSISSSGPLVSNLTDLKIESLVVL